MANLKEMYKAQINSIETSITNNISATEKEITVLNGSLLPDAPSLLVLGNGPYAETIKLVEKNIDILTVERGVQGAPKGWNAGTTIARNFTAYDHDTFKENIEKLNNEKVDKEDGKGLSSEDYTKTEKEKLSSIEAGANNYIHPATHSVDMIIESKTKKFMTMSEKEKLSSIEAGANNYIHPQFHDASEIKTTTLQGTSSTTLDKTIKTLDDKIDGKMGKGMWASSLDVINETSQEVFLAPYNIPRLMDGVAKKGTIVEKIIRSAWNDDFNGHAFVTITNDGLCHMVISGSLAKGIKLTQGFKIGVLPIGIRPQSDKNSTTSQMAASGIGIMTSIFGDEPSDFIYTSILKDGSVYLYSFKPETTDMSAVMVNITYKLEK